MSMRIKNFVVKTDKRREPLRPSPRTGKVAPKVTDEVTFLKSPLSNLKVTPK
jgi:hypothetical protein